jgi:hypothetical protein
LFSDVFTPKPSSRFEWNGRNEILQHVDEFLAPSCEIGENCPASKSNDTRRIGGCVRSIAIVSAKTLDPVIVSEPRGHITYNTAINTTAP